MKMRVPTKVTIVHMNAVSGSSSQPRRTVSLPSSNQVKLWVRCAAGFARAVLKAAQERKNESASAPMAAPAARVRARRGTRAPRAAARSGRAGMSQRNWAERLMGQPLRRLASCKRMLCWWR